MLTLLVMQGPDKGRRFELPDSLVLIGRDSQDLPLADNTVSRRHAELIPISDDWLLRDLGSSNGSYINGLRIDGEHSLKLGDQIRVGRTLMVFGAQPGISRTRGDQVALSGAEVGMDSSIMQTIASNEDSIVLAMPEPGAAAIAHLKILYRLSAALGSSFSIQQILEVVMDLIFEHVKADRGMILLNDEKTGNLTARVVRTRDIEKTARTTETLDVANVNHAEEIHASRTIINHVMSKGEGVLSSNAMNDMRFSKGKSIHDLGIRSALCVPIVAHKVAGNSEEGMIGVIYIDSSVKNYTYSKEQLRLLTAMGLQAGMAISNAKLYQAGLQAERMAAIGETTAALSHSIKNILQALHGGADVVELGLRNNNLPQANKGWKIVERNLGKIYGLTMNLLAYSRPREPKIEMINPKALIEDCLELISLAANEKGVMAVADIDPDPAPIAADADGLHQVLMNLLSNALDAVRPGKGLIRVVYRYEADRNHSVLDVIDNGAGVPQPMMDHMFELFHSTKGNRGTGLGLAVAKKIIEEHDGSITVRSRRNEGTTFTIRIPANLQNLADASDTRGPTK